MEGNFPFRKDLMDQRQAPLPVAALLKLHRENVNLTTGQLADYLGIKEDRVLAVERGVAQIPPELLTHWALVLETNPLYIATRYLNEISSKFCRRAGLNCTISVSIGVADDADELLSHL